jgi:hypothetical protein
MVSLFLKGTEMLPYLGILDMIFFREKEKNGQFVGKLFYYLQ